MQGNLVGHIAVAQLQPALVQDQEEACLLLHAIGRACDCPNRQCHPLLVAAQPSDFHAHFCAASRAGTTRRWLWAYGPRHSTC